MQKSKTNKIRRHIAVAILILGIIFALYVAIWVMLIGSIMAACAAFDAGALTAKLVGTTVLKVLFAGPVFTAISYGFLIIARLIAK